MEPRRHRRELVRTGAAAAGAATLVNVLVYGIGRAAGASFTVPGAQGFGEVTLVPVLIMSLLPLVLGLAVAAALAGLGRSTRWLEALGAVVALGSLFPFAADGWEGGTVAALALMHVVTGGAFVAALRLARRTADAATPSTASPAQSAAAAS